MLKFGVISTRFKDIFDFYYLINNTELNKDELLSIFNILILSDNSMRENTIEDIVKDLKRILNDKRYEENLNNIKNNWLEIPVDEVISNVLNFFESLQTISA